MADQKISELTAYTVLIDTDILPVVDVTTDITKKITYASLKTNLFNSPTLVTPNIGVATATSIAIGANTLDTNEWAFLDGLDQSVNTTSTVQHTKLSLGMASAGASYLMDMLIPTGQTILRFCPRLTDEIVGNSVNFAPIIGTGTIGVGNALGGNSWTITDGGANPLKTIYEMKVNVGDSTVVGLTINDDATVEAKTALTVNYSGGGAATGANLILKRTDGSVAAGNVTGQIDFVTSDTQTTTNFIAAQIKVLATNTIATDINPGAMIFSTTPTGVAAALTESFRITNAQAIQLAEATNIIAGTTTGTKIGTATNEKIAFHNSTPVIQRAGAAQAAVATTGATNVTPYGFTTAAQADAIVTLLNEIRAALVEKGLIKGAA